MYELAKRNDKRALLVVPIYSEAILTSKYYEKHIDQAEAIIFDFEDSLPRQLLNVATNTTLKLIEKYKNSGVKMIIRVNNDFAEQDIGFVNSIEQIKSIILPKIQNVEDYVFRIQLLRPDIKIIPVFETAYSVLHGENIFENEINRVEAFIFGSEDLSAEIGIWADNTNLLFAAQKCILISKMFKKPIYGTQGKFTGYEGSALQDLTNTLKISKNLGFDGCFAIHPKQIKIINEIFGTNDEELKKYNDILKKENSDLAVQSYSGEMIGPPTFNRIKKILGN